MLIRRVIIFLVLMVVPSGMPLIAGDDLEDTFQARQDHQHMVSLVQENDGRPISIDLSDVKQHRFVMRRLANAGKTPDNSPYFFQLINEMKKNGANAKEPGQGSSFLEGDPHFSESDHFPLDLVAESNLDFVGRAFSTVHGGTAFTYIDVATWDANWTQVGTLGWSEEYDEGTMVIAESYGSFPESVNDSLIVDTLQFNHPSAYGIISLGGSYGNSKFTALPEADVEMPTLTTGNTTDKVYVCLNRYNSDCDYSSMGNGDIMKLPFKGEFKLSPAYNFVGFLGGSSLKLSGLDGDINGGTASFVRTRGAPIEDLFSNSNNGVDEFIHWNIGVGDGDFGHVIFNMYETVNWFLEIKLTVASICNCRPNTEMVATVSSTGGNVTTTGPILPLSFWFSCLAAGSEILLPDGTKMPVEDVQIGQPVSAGNGVLTVVDTSVGIERLPMVRIRDERGKTLLLTEGHPLLTPDGNILLASDMKVGQLLTTIDGVTQLASVRREMYPGHVFNLKVGTPEELASMASNSNTMYANDFLVGDLVMQKEQQFKKKDKGPLLARLPKPWHQDYINSQKR